MKRKSMIAVISMLAILALLVAACGGGNSQNGGANNSAPANNEGTSNEGASNNGGDAGEPAAKIAIVFATGGLGDRNFNDNAHAGLLRAKEELGITFDYVEPQEIAEFETHHRAFASSGDYDLIIANSFDQLDAVKNVSAEFPDQKFLLLDTVFDGEGNVASATFISSEASFLAGAISAQKSETKKIGFVGGADIPLINEFLAGYEAGAKFVDPSVEVVANYTNDWANPNLGKEIAVSMYENGADIVYAAAGGSGNGVFTAAKEQGKWTVGADMTPAQEPDNMVVGTLKRIDNTIYNNIQALLDGTWEPGHSALGLADDAVGYSVEGTEIEISQDIIDTAEQLKEQVISGELKVPGTLEEVEAFLSENQ